jgi:hypothetical protein
VLLRRSLRLLGRAAPSLIAVGGLSLLLACSKSEELASLLSESSEATDEAVELTATEDSSSSPQSATLEDTESVPPELSDTESEPMPSGVGGRSEPSPSGEGGEAAIPSTETSEQAGASMGGTASTNASGSAGQPNTADTGGAPALGGAGNAGSGTTFGGAGGTSGTGGIASSAGGSGGVAGSASGGAPGNEACVPDVLSANPKANSLISDFSSTSGFMLNSCFSVSGGQGLAEPGEAPNAGNYCMFWTAAQYDLTCSSVAVKVPERTRSSSTPTGALRRPDPTTMRCKICGGEFASMPTLLGVK